MPSYPANTNLAGITFTAKADKVTVNANVSGSDTGIIIPATVVDTLGGNDVVSAKLKLTAGDSTTGDAAGIGNSGVIRMSAGADQLIGEIDAKLGNNTSWDLFGIVNTPAAIDTGDGADLVKGSVAVHAGLNFNGSVRGINNFHSTILTGLGNDSVTGIAKVWAGDYTLSKSVDVSGIFGGVSNTIDTGDDSDRVSGVAEFYGGKIEKVVNILTSGIANETVITGLGDDKVSGSATATVKDEVNGGEVEVNAIGIYQGSVDTEGGKDEVSGTAWSKAGAGGEANAYGIANSQIDTGTDKDRVVAEARAEGDFAFAYGIQGSEIDLGTGNDSLDASAKASGGTAFASGITDCLSFLAGDGDDRVTAKAEAAGSNLAQIQAIGIDGTGAPFNLGIGNDSLDARAKATGPGSAAYGIIFGNIETGDGKDYVFAEGNATGGGSTGYGIALSILELGAGNDHLVTRGSTVGIYLVDIFGEAGNDTFDIGKGRGFINGGGDYDLLILEGKKADYTFFATGLGEVDIDNLANGTDLSVFDIECFKFANGTFTYDQLFGP